MRISTKFLGFPCNFFKAKMCGQYWISLLSTFNSFGTLRTLVYFMKFVFFIKFVLIKWRIVFECQINMAIFHCQSFNFIYPMVLLNKVSIFVLNILILFILSLYSSNSFSSNPWSWINVHWTIFLWNHRSLWRLQGFATSEQLSTSS